MFVYEKKLQYPVKIANPNPRLASFIISQYGGPYTVLLLYGRLCRHIGQLPLFEYCKKVTICYNLKTRRRNI